MKKKTEFIGRARELEVLNRAYQSENNEFYPIYGRRRVGKSRLIKEFLKGKNSIYYLGKKAIPALQMKEFLESASKSLEYPLLEDIEKESWKTVIESILKIKSNEKIIIVMDEFQWISEASPELPSILQGFIDHEWNGHEKVFLIICGSYMGFMEKEILGEKSPLYGRRTGQVLLKPFSYLEAANFHPNWSWEDKAMVYFLCGGIPYYLNFFKETDSIPTNIINNFIDEFSALSKEPDFLLKEELRELEKYNTILVTLSTGSLTLKVLSAQSRIEERKINYYLKNLMQLGYVKKHYPLSHLKQNKNSVRYILSDPLLKFWFRFIYPNQSYISMQKNEVAYQQIVEPQLSAYFGYCFESLCRDAMAYIYLKEAIQGKFDIGEYWDQTIQIDIIGLRSDGRIDIGECKWGEYNVSSCMDQLKQKIEKYPNPENLTLSKKLFTRKAKTAKAKELWHYSLEDLYHL